MREANNPRSDENMEQLLAHARSSIVYEGWLQKKGGGKGAGRRNWKRRWFILHKSFLFYCKKRDSKVPQGIIRLEDARVFRESESEKPSKKPVFYLSIVQSVTQSKRFHNRTFKLVAETQDQVDAWIAALQKQILALSQPNLKDRKRLSEQAPGDTPAALVAPHSLHSLDIAKEDEKEKKEKIEEKIIETSAKSDAKEEGSSSSSESSGDEIDDEDVLMFAGSSAARRSNFISAPRNSRVVNEARTVLEPREHEDTVNSGEDNDEIGLMHTPTAQRRLEIATLPRRKNEQRNQE